MCSLDVLRTRCRTAKRSGTPNGIRTRAATLKGWCPRPLDDGGLGTRLDESVATLTGLPAVSTRRLVGHLSGPRSGGSVVVRNCGDCSVKEPRQEVVQREFIMTRVVCIEIIVDFTDIEEGAQDEPNTVESSAKSV